MPSRASKRISRDSVEFARVLAFTDGVFAIAITLLVLGISEPVLGARSGDAGALWDALGDLLPEIISFFIGFAVIGRYWVAHHQNVGQLSAMDYGFVGLNLVYLCFIALLPFPTELLGSYLENPVAVAVYAAVAGIVSGLEVVLFRHSFRRDLLARPLPERIFRWGATMSLLPVLFFLLSVPVAFVGTGLALGMWFLVLPAELVLKHWMPPDFDDYF